MKAALLAIAFSFAAALPAAAQTPLFAQDDEIAITIEGPINNIVGRMRGNTDPQPARLTYGNQTWDIQLSARGQSRRIGGACTFPPLRVDFGDQRLRGTLFQGQKRIKLVTRCRPADSYEQLTLLEYTAYRLYNEITPMSVRARLARVTYRDNREQNQLNFFIEDPDDMARRNRRVELDVQRREVRVAELDPQAATRFALFQYMISNVDWDMTSAHEDRDCCHNTILISQTAEARGAVVPVPYDFDQSGLVDAPYAAPLEELRQTDVRQRVYRGYCRHNDQVPAAIAHFQSRREALLGVIDGETRLANNRRTSARRFVEQFFAVIDDPERVQQQILNRCRG